MLSVNDVDVICPNFKRRLSGVTATVVRLVPLQAKSIAIATVAPDLPARIPQVSFWSLFTMSRRGPSGYRVWHARRNSEMLIGLLLSLVLRKKLKLVFTSASQRHHTWISRALIERMDAVVSTSNATARYLRRPSQVIHHGIDVSAFSPTTDRARERERLGLPVNGLLMGCFGRIRAQKGTDLFVDASISLCQSFPELTAVVMGRALPKDQAFLTGLKQRVAAAGLKGRILFRQEAQVWEMPDWYRALDVYIAPQRWEGFGLTPIEAMACGVPVIASRVGAFSEMIVQNETGLLVDEATGEDFAEATAKLLDNPRKLRLFGSAARAHVEQRFDIREESRALISLYQRLLAGQSEDHDTERLNGPRDDLAALVGQRERER